jgi:TRAP-type C4-dicarboxylate transport system permease small subunit
MMAVLKKADAVVGRILSALMIATTASLMLLVTFIVVIRLFSLGSAAWTDEVVEFFFGWLVFLGAAALWREKGHFAITMVPDLVLKTDRQRKILALITEFLCLPFLILFVYESYVLIDGASDTSPVFSISKAYWYVVMPISGVIMGAYSIARVVQHIIDLSQGRYAAPPPSTEIDAGKQAI